MTTIRIGTSELGRGAFAAALAAALLSGCRNYPKQFALMCTTAEQVESELGQVADGVQRQRIWAERVSPQLSGDASKVLAVVSGQSLPPAKKYELLQQGAAECGVPSYECAAIKKLFDDAASAQK